MEASDTTGPQGLTADVPSALTLLLPAAEPPAPTMTVMRYEVHQFDAFRIVSILVGCLSIVFGLLVLLHVAFSRIFLRTWFLVVLGTWFLLDLPSLALFLAFKFHGPIDLNWRKHDHVLLRVGAYYSWLYRALYWVLLLFMASDRAYFVSTGKYKTLLPGFAVCSVVFALGIAMGPTTLMSQGVLDPLVFELIGIGVVGLIGLWTLRKWTQSVAWQDDDVQRRVEKRLFWLPLAVVGVRAVKFLVPFYVRRTLFVSALYGTVTEDPCLRAFDIAIRVGVIILVLVFNPYLRKAITLRTPFGSLSYQRASECLE